MESWLSGILSERNIPGFQHSNISVLVFQYSAIPAIHSFVLAISKSPRQDAENPDRDRP
jgi:hypothetical protein